MAEMTLQAEMKSVAEQLAQTLVQHQSDIEHDLGPRLRERIDELIVERIASRIVNDVVERLAPEFEGLLARLCSDALVDLREQQGALMRKAASNFRAQVTDALARRLETRLEQDIQPA